MVYCYLDFDLDDSRAAYARACDFVDKCSIKYGLSTNVLAELGGREKLSIPELVANDFNYGSKGRVQCQPQAACRMVFELFPDISPLACENFIALCTGEKGKSKQSGLLLHYQGCTIHRYVSNFVMQGGDFVFGNGSGGESIWGKKFKDDTKGLKQKHNKRGVLSMGNSGKNSNSSQFFITLGTEGAKACDGKHTVFGQVIHGFEVLDLIEQMKTAATVRAGTGAGAATTMNGGDAEVPPFSIVITSCGVWTEDLPITGYWAEDDSFKPFATTSACTSVTAVDTIVAADTAVAALAENVEHLLLDHKTPMPNKYSESGSSGSSISSIQHNNSKSASIKKGMPAVTDAVKKGAKKL